MEHGVRNCASPPILSLLVCWLGGGVRNSQDAAVTQAAWLCSLLVQAGLRRVRAATQGAAKPLGVGKARLRMHYGVKLAGAAGTSGSGDGPRPASTLQGQLTRTAAETGPFTA